MTARVDSDPDAIRLVALVARAKADPGSVTDADEVRELYGELVDRYRDDADSMASLRALGDDIRARESDGSLARTMVARSERRPRRT